MNDHLSDRKPWSIEWKQDVEFFAFTLMESDVDFPARAHEANRNFWTYRHCQTTVALPAWPVSVNNRSERQWGRMTRIRLTGSSVLAAEATDTIGASSMHLVAISPTSSPQVAWRNSNDAQKEVNNRPLVIRAIRNRRHVANNRC